VKYPKPSTPRDKKYLKWLRTQLCVFCGEPAKPNMDVVPMHKGGGMALKGSDYDALPGCVECHRREHELPITFWRMIYVQTGKRREQLVEEHRKRYKEKK